MKKKLRQLLALTCAGAIALSLAACGTRPSDDTGGDKPGSTVTDPDAPKPDEIEEPEPDAPEIKFTDNHESGTKGFNNELYYINNLDFDMGDPALVYDDVKKVFYAAGTKGSTGFDFYKSTDLVTWSKVTNGGFHPETSSWGKYDLWAPDVHKIGNKWYLYYTANYLNSNPGAYDKNKENHCQIGVAVSDNPYGPYEQWTGVNADGVTKGLRDLPFDGMEHNTILDQHVFVDDDGQMYMYFSYDTQYDTDPARRTGVAEIYGVKMKDAVTWDLSTLTRLIVPGFEKLDADRNTVGKKTDVAWETWSLSFTEPMECTEGPYMIKKNGKYILTYCANSYVDTNYAVGYAVSDKPLGSYVKPNEGFLDNMICGVPAQEGSYAANRYLGFTTGTGHASICQVGDEYLLAYHAHMNRDAWKKTNPKYPGNPEWRALGVDYIYFDGNGMPYSNGPTYSLQRLPEAISGYKNLAAFATVTIDGQGVDKNAQCKFVNDNRLNKCYMPDAAWEASVADGDYKAREENIEVQFKAGKHSIKLTFAEAVTVKAVNIYNSYDYNKHTEKIATISFGKKGYVENILFNTADYINDAANTSLASSQEWKAMYPNAAYNVELEKEVTTDNITIIIDCDHDFAIGEVEILGKIAA